MTALQVLKDPDAVPALIEALDDKEQLVRQASAETLDIITLRDSPYGGEEKGKAQMDSKGWSERWKKNETRIRAGLGQSK